MQNNNNVLRLVAVGELIFFVGFALISKRVADPFFWRYAGPVSLIIVLVLLTGYMRWRGERWSSMGLIPLPGARAKLMLIPKTLLAFVAFSTVAATALLGGEALGLEFMTEVPEGVDERWGDIEGNLPLFLLWLGIVWTVGAFGEEMFFRGFIITRLQSVFSGVKFASVIAVIGAAAFFGYVHMYYQGMRGFVMAGAIGLAFGATFLLMKRNLYPVIFVHGIINTLTFTVQYLGLEE